MKKIILIGLFTFLALSAVTIATNIRPTRNVVLKAQTMYNDGNVAYPDSMYISVAIGGATVFDGWYNSGDAGCSNTADTFLQFVAVFNDINGDSTCGSYTITVQAYDADSALYTPFVYIFDVGQYEKMDSLATALAAIQAEVDNIDGDAMADVSGLATSVEIAALNDFDPASDSVLMKNRAEIAAQNADSTYDKFLEGTNENAFKADVTNLDVAVSTRSDFDESTDRVKLGGDTLNTIANSIATNLDATVSSRSDFDNTSDQVIVGTNNDKTGYALSTAGIDAIMEYTFTNISSPVSWYYILYQAMANLPDSTRLSRILGRKVWGIASGVGSDSTTLAQRKGTMAAASSDAKVTLVDSSAGHISYVANNPGDYKADVSLLALSSELTPIIDTVNATLDSLQLYDDRWALETSITEMLARLDSLGLWLGFWPDAKSKKAEASNCDTLWMLSGVDTIGYCELWHVGGSTGDAPDSTNCVRY